MCLVALALQQHPRYPLVLASNRDEFFARAAQPLAWWQGGSLLGGRDLQAGGSWLLLHRSGQLALVTNVREPGREQPGLASRGELVATALQHEAAQAAALATPRNGFNLLRLDAVQGTGHWHTNRPQAQSQPLAPGVHGLSNAALNTPWPKVALLRQGMEAALKTQADPEDLELQLFAALANTQPAADAELPNTGIGLLRERQLSSAHIRIEDVEGQAVYGTRCATVVVAEARPEGLQIRVRERSFDPWGALTGDTLEVFSPQP